MGTDVLVFLDREQGGKETLEEKNISVHSVINVKHLMEILHDAKKISDEEKKNVEDFVQNFGPNHQIMKGSLLDSVQKMTIKERFNSEKCQSHLAKRLFDIMEEK